MKQAVGAGLVLLGAIMYHIAASDLPKHNFLDVWNDFRNVLSGSF